MISTLENIRLKNGNRVLVKIGPAFYRAKVVNASDPAKLRVELQSGAVLWTGRESIEMVFEYLVVKDSEWPDFSSVAGERGLEVEYSIEDASEGEGIEYHIHSHLEEVEDILWAIQVQNEYEAGVQEPEPVLFEG